MLHLFGKEIALLIIVFSLCFGLKAQPVGTNLTNYDKQWLHFGISLSGNGASYKIYRDLSLNADDSIMAVNSGRLPGFGVGIISNISFLEYFDFRFIPSLIFSGRRIWYDMITGDRVNKDEEFINVEFPFHLKLKSARMDNFRFYTIGGLKYTYNMVSNYNATDDRSGYLVITKPGAWFSEYGIGTDFYFEMFKFSIELKLSDGLGDVMIPNSDLRYSRVINALLPKSYMISLHFE